MMRVTRFRYPPKPPPSIRPPATMEGLPAVDPFSVARVKSFAKRQRAEIVAGSMTVGDTHFVAWDIHLGGPTGTLHALGAGPSDKPRAAEMACAMHAELLVDASGHCLYADETMQRRYVEQRAREGRRGTAPLTSNPRKIPVECVPSPLCGGKAIAVGGKIIGGPEVVEKGASETNSEATEQQAQQPTAQQAQQPKLGAPRPSLGMRRPSTSAAALLRQVATASGRERRVLLRRLSRRSTPPRSTVDESEGGTYQLTNISDGRIAWNANTLQSPVMYDRRSIVRVASWLEYHKRWPRGRISLDDTDSIERGLESLALIHEEDIGGVNYFTVTLPLWDEPLQRSLGGEIPAPKDIVGPATIVAKAKASHKPRALVLLAMHAELIIDAAGIPLHPQDTKKQQEHERTLVAWNRAGQCLPSKATSISGRLMPAPLKELHPYMNDYSYRHIRFCTPCTEERFFRYHGEAVRFTRTLVEVNVDDDEYVIPGFDTHEEAQEALRDWQRRHGMRQLYFVVTFDQSDTYRAQILLHNLDKAREKAFTPESSTESDSFIIDESEISRLRSENGVPPLERMKESLPICALGVAQNPSLAKTLCIAHALELVARANLPLFRDAKRQAAYDDARRQLGLYTAHPSGVAPRRVEGHTDVEVGGFQVSIAMSPAAPIATPCRATTVPTFAEERFMSMLHTQRDFQPVNIRNFSMGSVHERLHKWCALTLQPLPPAMTVAKVRMNQCPWMMRSLQQDVSADWRHRSTVWMRLMLPLMWEGKRPALFHRVYAIGRCLRVRDAEQLCLLHAAALLWDAGFDVLSPLGEDEKKILGLGDFVASPMFSCPPHAPFDDVLGRPPVLNPRLLPLVSESTRDALRPTVYETIHENGVALVEGLAGVTVVK